MTIPVLKELFREAQARLVEETAIPSMQVRGLLSPYRICPLGAHIDHQGGAVIGRTMDTGTALAFYPLSEPQVRLYSLQFGDWVTFEIGDPVVPGHWARYAQAAARLLAERYPLRHGLVGMLNGVMLGAGLSSSTSVSLAYLQALAVVNDFTIPKMDLLRLSQQLENEQLGLMNGILDQGSILFGKGYELLHIQTRPVKITPLPSPGGDTCWLIIYSGQQRSLAESSYNERVDECRQAADLLMPGAQRFSDVSRDLFYEREAQLPERLKKRAAHFYSEVERVDLGMEAWLKGDLYTFGELMDESCESSFNFYESGNEQLAALHEITRGMWGAYGSRFCGGGYGGCLVVLARFESVDRVAYTILKEYNERYPELADRATWFLAGGADGLRIVDHRGLD